MCVVKDLWNLKDASQEDILKERDIRRKIKRVNKKR
jgi:hypothetical protein